MKAALVLLSAFLFVVSTHAQGTVVFNNTASPNYRLWTNNLTGGANFACCGLYRIGLYASTDLMAPEQSLSLMVRGTNAGPAALAGYFNGGSAVPIAGVPTGSQIRFQIRAWSLFAGLSYEEALAAAAVDPLNVALGASLLGTTTVGGGTVLPGPLFGTSPGLLASGFCIGPVQCVPEPSTSALAFLGVLAFLTGRRHVKRAQESRQR